MTNQTGARATISFEGNSIALYGATSDNHGQYTVVLDGGLSMQLNGAAPQGMFRPKNMLVRRHILRLLDVSDLPHTCVYLVLCWRPLE